MSDEILKHYRQIANLVDSVRGTRLCRDMDDLFPKIFDAKALADVLALQARDLKSSEERLVFAEQAVAAEDKVHDLERQLDTLIKDIHKAAVHQIHKARKT